MAEHGPLGPSRCAGSIENCRKIICLPCHRVKTALPICQNTERALPVPVERDNLSRACHLAQTGFAIRITHKDTRCCVCDEISNLCIGVGRVERQENGAGHDSAEVQLNRGKRFVNLNRHPITRFHST